MVKKVAVWVIGAGIVLFLGIQLVPYGRDHTNPPTVQRNPSGTA